VITIPQKQRSLSFRITDHLSSEYAPTSGDSKFYQVW
jgi:hypothetical protein